MEVLAEGYATHVGDLKLSEYHRITLPNMEVVIKLTQQSACTALRPQAASASLSRCATSAARLCSCESRPASMKAVHMSDQNAHARVQRQMVHEQVLHVMQTAERLTEQ